MASDFLADRFANARGWSTLGLEFWRFCCLQRALRYHSTGPLYCCIFGSLSQQAPSASLTCIARLFQSLRVIWNPNPTQHNANKHSSGLKSLDAQPSATHFYKHFQNEGFMFKAEDLYVNHLHLHHQSPSTSSCLAFKGSFTLGPMVVVVVHWLWHLMSHE
jgi:hypothetical protein